MGYFSASQKNTPYIIILCMRPRHGETIDVREGEIGAARLQKPGPRLLVCLSILCGVVMSSLVILSAAQAQSGERAVIFGLNTKNFPSVQASLVAFDANNAFIKDLQLEQIHILEGSQSVVPYSLEYSRPGVQFVAAVSLGPAMSVRDGQGNSRLDYLKAEMLIQASSYPSQTQDDLSMMIAGGPELLHTTAPQKWLDTLVQFQPENLREISADLEVLGRALTIVNNSPPRPGMGKAILFITPPQPLSAAPGLRNLANTARQQDVRVFVWLVSAQADALTVGADALKDLAAQTGGYFVNFDQPAPLPALDEALEPLRNIYTLGYTSTLRANGVYTIGAQVNVNGNILLSSPVDIQVDLQLPNPIFSDLPVRVERWARPTSGVNPAEPAYVFSPESQQINVVVEFPDGHSRGLTSSTLFVNGKPVDVNETAPFESFTWDLTSITYTQDTTHILRVEVMDDLGLTGSSLEMPVDIHVDYPQQQASQAAVTPRTVLIFLAAAVVLGAVAGLVLVIAGRLQPGLLGQGRRWQRPAKRTTATTIPLAALPQPPATRPLGQSTSGRRLPNWISRLQRSPVESGTQPLAYLTPIDDGGEPGLPIPIQNNETTFGRDSEKANWTLDHPSLESLHARLRREGSDYRLLDEGTTAGTWINYCEIPPGGARLYHGDLVHIGRIGFRFTLRDTRHPRKPVITLYTGHLPRSSSHDTH